MAVLILLVKYIHSKQAKKTFSAIVFHLALNILTGRVLVKRYEAAYNLSLWRDYVAFCIKINGLSLFRLTIK